MLQLLLLGDSSHSDVVAVRRMARIQRGGLQLHMVRSRSTVLGLAAVGTIEKMVLLLGLEASKGYNLHLVRNHWGYSTRSAGRWDYIPFRIRFHRTLQAD